MLFLALFIPPNCSYSNFNRKLSASLWGERNREPDRQAEDFPDGQFSRLKHRLGSGHEQHISEQKQVPFWRSGRQWTGDHDQETTLLDW